MYWSDQVSPNLIFADCETQRRLISYGKKETIEIGRASKPQELLSGT